jgi:dipeptidyl aminopeptidase/acylaminoacyl peptidase
MQPAPACLAFAALFPTALAPLPAQAPAQAPRGFSVDDMLAMDRISDPQVSPDGQWVAFNVRVTDLAANRGRTDVWLVKLDGSAPRRLTFHEAADFNARWMPDSKSIVFLSTRSGSSQVWQLRIDGGEPRELSKFPLDVGNLSVFPDGKRLLFTMEVDPKLKTLEENQKADEARAAKQSTGKLYEQLMVRHWDTWADEKRSHVFAWTLGAEAPVDLMAGMDVDSPIQPFGGTEDMTISADSSTVVFAAKSVGREAAWSTNNDVWSVPADGSAAPVCLSAANKAQDPGAFEQFSQDLPAELERRATVHGYVVRSPGTFEVKPGSEIPGGVPDPRRPAGQLGKQLPLSLESRRPTRARATPWCSSISTAPPATARPSPTRSRGDWGGKPLEDLQKGWAHALAKYASSTAEPRLRAGCQLRWLHDQLDRRQLV